MMINNRVRQQQQPRQQASQQQQQSIEQQQRICLQQQQQASQQQLKNMYYRLQQQKLMRQQSHVLQQRSIQQQQRISLQQQQQQPSILQQLQQQNALKQAPPQQQGQSNSLNALHGSLEQTSPGSLQQQQALKQQPQQYLEQRMLEDQDQQQQLVQQKLQQDMQQQMQVQVQDDSKLDIKRAFAAFVHWQSELLQEQNHDQESFPATALPILRAVFGTPGIFASPFLDFSPSPAQVQDAAAPGTPFGEEASLGDPYHRLLKIVGSMSSNALSSAAREMKSVISLSDMLAASGPGPGCRAAVGEDLAASTKCRLQARPLVSQEGGAMKKLNKRYLDSIALSVISSDGSVANSLQKPISNLL